MTVIWVVLSALLCVVTLMIAWLISRALHILPDLSPRDMRLVQTRRGLQKEEFSAAGQLALWDFDNTHPWVKRWERRWGKGE